MRRADSSGRITRPTLRVRTTRPHLKFERQLRADGVAQVIAGIDEAGRGPLAGPVVAAAVVLPEDFRHRAMNDSKKLTPETREAIYGELTASTAIVWSCAALDAGQVDRLNILRAAHEAMRRAVLGLAVAVDHALIDGLPVRPFPIAHTALVSGDSRSLSIAAASVIAKVTRDRMMVELCARYPAYGFSRHKGYPTDEHLATLDRHGPCPIHRRSFGPVARYFLPVEDPERSTPSLGLGG